MNFKDIPIPELMKNLPKDSRGFPIPYVVLIDDNKVPHFKVNDDRRNERCIANKMCHICGVPLINSNIWFIGGMLSAFHPNGAFNDGAVHKECGVYALKVCPYLAYTQYQAKSIIDTSKIATADNKNMIYVNPTQDLERLDFFCLVRAAEYRITGNAGFRYIHPKKPYLEVEYWRDGEQITVEQAKEFLREKEKADYLPIL